MQEQKRLVSNKVDRTLNELNSYINYLYSPRCPYLRFTILIPNVSVQAEYKISESAQGVGLIDTTRGALGHWLKITNSVISFYQIITPSAWNISTRSSNGLKGTTEQALIGTTVQDIENPVEMGRIIRSFDPCISCATHIISGGKHTKTLKVVP